MTAQPDDHTQVSCDPNPPVAESGWQEIESAPKLPGDENEIIALWLDSRGDYIQVFVHYDASNDPAVVGAGRGHNHGFIGRHGNLYGAGGLKFWRHKFPLPAPPYIAAVKS